VPIAVAEDPEQAQPRFAVAARMDVRHASHCII
jgi:hypothetical protein